MSHLYCCCCRTQGVWTNWYIECESMPILTLSLWMLFTWVMKSIIHTILILSRQIHRSEMNKYDTGRKRSNWRLRDKWALCFHDFHRFCNNWRFSLCSSFVTICKFFDDLHCFPRYAHIFYDFRDVWRQSRTTLLQIVESEQETIAAKHGRQFVTFLLVPRSVFFSFEYENTFLRTEH